VSARKLLIRADGSTQIGTGHLMRCLALAQAGVDAGMEVELACAEIPEPFRARFQHEDVVTHEVRAAPGTPADAERTAALARELGADWLALDGYGFDPEYQRLARRGVRVLVVDDLQQFARYEADLLLNQNLGADPARYATVGDSKRLLLGPRFALLRREYRRWRSWTRPAPRATVRLLVTLGGSDPENVTARVLEAIRGLARGVDSVTVLIGASNPHGIALERLAGALRVPVALERDVRDMPEVLASAELAVAAGGTTSWELACMGLPSVVIAIADNQRPIAEALHRAGSAHSVGWHRDCDVRTIGEAVGRLIEAPEERERISRAGRELVDGLGAERVCAAMAEHE
jgi:UDP-2,4-diacetamido-2,4,6-trideoxy-beta-L-altropyranose hydrolase